MQPSQACIDLIAKYESFRANAYLDSVGVPTIGYGTTVYHNGAKVKLGDTIDVARAQQELLSHLQSQVVDPINKALTITPSQAQFDAMCCLTYNIGIGNFLHSSVLRYTNAGKFDSAQVSYLLWNKAGGQELLGLTRRRLSEATMAGPLTRQQLITNCLNGKDPG